jgi:hypothetical protein
MKAFPLQLMEEDEFKARIHENLDKIRIDE